MFLVIKIAVDSDFRARNCCNEKANVLCDKNGQSNGIFAPSRVYIKLNAVELNA